MTNLLSNAVKYSPHGGEILVRCTLEGSNVHISVQDEGMGIHPDMLDQVFIPYSRIHSATTQYIQGTGLGLPIVRQIVEMHAGKVWVESELDHGSCFHFTLPLHLQPVPPPEYETQITEPESSEMPDLPVLSNVTSDKVTAPTLSS